MQDPKQKAQELVEKYIPLTKVWDDTLGWCVNYRDAKKCALICVEEIIASSPSLPILGDGGTFGEDIELSKTYWQSVKQEITNN